MDFATAAELSPAEAKLRAWKPDPQMPEWFNSLRAKAVAAYFNLELPTRSDVEWHYGNPKDYSLDGLSAAGPILDESSTGLATALLLSGPVMDSNLLLMSGTSVTEVHTLPALRDKGVSFMSLRQALIEQPELLATLYQRSDLSIERSRSAAGLRALPDNGFILHLPRNVRLKQPLHLAVSQSEPGSMMAASVLISLEAGSEAEVYLHQIGENSAANNLLLCPIEAFVDQGASLKLTTLQLLGPASHSHSRLSAHIASDARFESLTINLGGRRVRSEVHALLEGRGAEAELLGLHLLRGRERYDFLTSQNHLAPHCRSNLLYKGAMLGRSKASYQGVIYVAPDAQKTDAYQSNRSLLLSGEARVDSSPQLEILANDVKCSHGSSISNVGKEALFYLESRGIDPQSARHLLISGFLREVADRIHRPELREFIAARLLEQLA